MRHIIARLSSPAVSKGELSALAKVVRAAVKRDEQEVRQRETLAELVRASHYTLVTSTMFSPMRKPLDTVRAGCLGIARPRTLARAALPRV